MTIIVAKNAGFCFGVRRAVEAVYEQLKRADKVYTYGPIIHNPQVVEALKAKGAIIVEDLDQIEEGTIVIRSHGVPPQVYRLMKDKGLQVVDATCPYVKRVHNLVSKYHGKGYSIIIVGEKEHPEVVGINGWCDDTAFVINDPEQVDFLPHMDKACVVAQTTTPHQKWNAIVERLHSKVDHLEVFNTICNTTAVRQAEAEAIAKTVDVMLVIGGKNSSNTRKLYSICKAHCEKTFAIETAKDIDINAIHPGDKVGITAGASTPDWIIKEVIDMVNQLNDGKTGGPSNEPRQGNDSRFSQGQAVQQEMQNEPVESNIHELKDGGGQSAPAPENAAQQEQPEPEMQSMEGFEKAMVPLRPGQVVRGTILKITPEEVIVNLGYKSDGVLPISELTLVDPHTGEAKWHEGDPIDVQVVKIDDGEGNVLLARKSLEKRLAWDELEESFKEGREVKGICTEVVKGGVLAEISGIQAFVPASHLSTRYVEDLNSFVGTTLRLKVLEIDRRRNRVVASQKVILQEEEEARRKALWDSIQEGQVVRGVVKRLTDFGAFVDIGGVDGLVHISDLSWGHVSHPSEVLQENQTITVKVLSVDRERGRISLGYKQTFPQPWDSVSQKYHVGDIVAGKVVRLTHFGAFVELEPGIDGLVHVSEISDERINKAADVLQVGQVVNAKILDIKPQQRKISLSIKEALCEQEEKELELVQQGQQSYEGLSVNLGELFSDKLKPERFK
ncbi:MAG: bifunctional 4-hydroxy-3-methylbut-2-enyl diphosphate reductase/30S ribosomal protein S1 [Clostridia bacterium]